MTDEYSIGIRATDGMSRISTDGTATVKGPFPNTTTAVEMKNVDDPFILGVHAVMNVEDVEDIAEGLMEDVRQGKYEDIIFAMNTLEGVCKNLREIAEKMKHIRQGVVTYEGRGCCKGEFHQGRQEDPADHPLDGQQG